jgi:hypothetical protein
MRHNIANQVCYDASCVLISSYDALPCDEIVSNSQGEKKNEIVSTHNNRYRRN